MSAVNEAGFRGPLTSGVWEASKSVERITQERCRHGKACEIIPFKTAAVHSRLLFLLAVGVAVEGGCFVIIRTGSLYGNNCGSAFSNVNRLSVPSLGISRRLAGSSLVSAVLLIRRRLVIPCQVTQITLTATSHHSQFPNLIHYMMLRIPARLPSEPMLIIYVLLSV